MDDTGFWSFDLALHAAVLSSICIRIVVEAVKLKVDGGLGVWGSGVDDDCIPSASWMLISRLMEFGDGLRSNDAMPLLSYSR